MKQNKKFGPWVFDIENFTLTHEGYEIDLDEIGTPAEMLDWISQLAQKSWMTPAAMGYLVFAFEEIFEPQANLCGSGQAKKMNARYFLRAKYGCAK